MKRWIAVMLLVLAGGFLIASGRDHCHEPGHDLGASHLLCLDDCAPAVMPAPPAAPPPDPMPEPDYALVPVLPLLRLDLEPEKTPPRA